MRQEINTKEMKEKLMQLGKHCKITNNISILSHFSIKNGFIYGTNLKSTFKVKMNIKESDLIFHFTMFKKIIDNLKTNTFILDDHSIISGKRTIILKGLDVEKFPSIPEFNGSYGVELQEKEIKLLLNTISQCDNRRFVSGINIKLNENNNISLCSTDGKQLTAIEKDLHHYAFSHNINNTDNVTIEFQDIKEANIKTSVLIEVDRANNLACFNNSGVEIYTHLLDASFPPYEKVIPDISEYLTTIEIDRLSLIEELTFLKKTTISKDNVKIELDYSALSSIKLISNDITSNNIEIEVESLTLNENIDCTNIFMTRDFLLNISRLLSGDRVIINIKDNLSTIVIKEDNIIYIAMPMVSA